MGRYGKRHGVIAATVMAAIIIIAVWAWPRRPKTEPPLLDTAAGRQAERSRLLDQWRDSSPVPIRSDGVAAVIADALDQPWDAPPRVGTAFDRGQLSAEQRDDLMQAIRGLLHAYASGTPADAVRYMAERDEELRPDSVTLYRKGLAEVTRRPPAAVAHLSGMELLDQYFTAIDYKRPEWDGLPRGEGKTTFWTATRLPDNESSGLYFSTRRENKAFGNITTLGHVFGPRGRSLPDTIKQAGRVLYVDLRVVITFTSAKFGEPRPHYIRFWYDPAGGKWHPLNLACVNTVSEYRPSIIF